MSTKIKEFQSDRRQMLIGVSPNLTKKNLANHCSSATVAEKYEYGITHLKLAFVIPIPPCHIQNLCHFQYYYSLKIKIDV